MYLFINLPFSTALYSHAVAELGKSLREDHFWGRLETRLDPQDN